MSSVPLDAQTYARLEPFIRRELRRLALAGAQSAAASLNHVFVSLFGVGRSREERLRFMMFAAPIARRVAIDVARNGETIGHSEIRAMDLELWLRWLETLDPRSARLVDMHYFAGMSAPDMAAAIGDTTAAVNRALRFAQAWLRARRMSAGQQGG